MSGPECRHATYYTINATYGWHRCTGPCGFQFTDHRRPAVEWRPAGDTPAWARLDRARYCQVVLREARRAAVAAEIPNTLTRIDAALASAAGAVRHRETCARVERPRVARRQAKARNRRPDTHPTTLRVRSQSCPECQRSNGPHYRGPCGH